MNATEIKQKLIGLRACESAKIWADGKTLAEIWEQCERGDWMLWLACRAGIDKRTMTAAKAECAATVKHLMKDPRSIKALEVAQAYGRGEATDEELAAAAAAADAAADDATDATAGDCGSCAAYTAAYAAYAAAADAYTATYAAKTKNQLQTAEIVRSIITIEMLKL